MNKEKLVKLVKYLDSVRAKLSDPVPVKHVARPEAYRAFLEKELALTSSKIQAMKL